MSRQDKLKIEALPLKNKAPAGVQSNMTFLIRITAPEIDIKAKRPELNLGLVLDRSGSMSGRKLENAKKAACFCIDQMIPTDRISVTVFDDTVRVLIPTTFATNKSTAKRMIRAIAAGSTTALHAAWVEGAKQVAECLDPKRLNRVLLMTDGLANVGETNIDTIVSQAEGLYTKGISTSTIGVGNDFNEDLLVPMATVAGGNSWFVEGPGDFQRIFETEMKGLLKEVCTKVSMRIAPREGVQVIDVLNDFDLSKKGKYRLPNLLAGEPLDVIAKISLPGKELGSFPIFDITVAWNPQGRSRRMYIEETAEIVYAPEDRVTMEPENSEVLKAIQLMKSARARREARTHMDRGEIGRAVNLLATHSLASKKMAQITGDSDLDADAQALAELMKNTRNRGEHPLARKKMAYQSHYRQRGRSAVR